MLTVVFGEDVAFGGVFRCTVGLKEKYGMYEWTQGTCCHEPSSRAGHVLSLRRPNGEPT